MAEVKDVVLQIGNRQAPELRVSVSYKLSFSPEEAGRNYKLEIFLFGRENGIETKLYTFMYPLNLPPSRFSTPYKTITPAAKKLMESYTDTAEVSRAALRVPEDIFAVVSLISEAKSSIVQVLDWSHPPRSVAR